MSYALEVHEPIRAEVRSLAHEQAGRALENLRAAARGDDADGGIHDARKRFKKIRAVLRLVRHDMGADAYHRENGAWRDAGRLVSDVRESAVLPGTVRRLGDTYEELVVPGPLESLAARLEERHRSVLEAALREGGPLEGAVERAEEARNRIDAWPLGARGFALVRPGLRKVYKRGRNRMADAYADPSGPAFHEWRKRVKYLWYQIRMLAPAWGVVLEPWAEAQHELADLLGEANDLTDLLASLRDAPDLADDRLASLLAGVATRRRKELWERAHPLGMRLYAENPDQFVERMASYWDVARV